MQLNGRENPSNKKISWLTTGKKNFQKIIILTAPPPPKMCTLLTDVMTCLIFLTHCACIVCTKEKLDILKIEMPNYKLNMVH